MLPDSDYGPAERSSAIYTLDRIFGLEYNDSVVEVIGTDEFVAWYRLLTETEKKAVTRVVDMLEEAGVNLRFPYSSALQDSRYPLRELRPRQGNSPLRVIYVFDPGRNAVLLIGGDKTGDKPFYARIIPTAEKIWAAYLAEHAAGLHDEE